MPTVTQNGAVVSTADSVDPADVSYIGGIAVRSSDGAMHVTSGLTSDQLAALASLTNGGTTYYPLVSLPLTSIPMIVIGGTAATYSQTTTVVTVTWAAHGMTAALNGASVHLTQSTGALLTGWFTSFTYVDANTFTCVSGVSQTTAGNLGVNTAKTTCLSVAIPAGALGPNGKTMTHATWVIKNSAANKEPTIDFGALQVWITGITTSNVFTSLASIANCNSQSVNRVIATPYGGGVGGTNVVPSRGTVDTSVSQNLVFSMTLAAGTEWGGIWAPSVSYCYGA